MAETSHLLELLIDSSPVYVYMRDLEGRFTYTSASFDAKLGLERRQFHGLTVFDLLPKDEADFMAANDRRAMASTKAVEVKETVKTPDGLCVLLSIKFALRDESGEPYALCGISTDITERAHSEDETQAREDASQVREAASEAREDASQVRATASQAREDASQVRELASEARERDTADVHESMSRIIEGVLGKPHGRLVR